MRLTPRASADVVDGVIATTDGPALKVKVRAVPEKGAANRALEKVLAAWLGIPKSTVGLVKGQKSRLKTVHISGDAKEQENRLRARIKRE